MFDSDKYSEGLEGAFKRQSEFHDIYVKEKYGKALSEMSQKEIVDMSKDMTLHLHTEISEFLQTLPNWKSHRKLNERLIETNTQEELTDIFKFFLILCMAWGLDEKTLIQHFHRKSFVVENRYRQESEIKKLGNRVCAVDIDGVLADSYKVIRRFIVNSYLEENLLDSPKRNEVRHTLMAMDFGALKEVIGIANYEKYKEQYRISGQKAKLPVKEGSLELVDFINDSKISTVVISARPYDKYTSIYAETLYWLKENGFKFQGLYFGVDKCLEIAQRLPNLMFMVEDNIDQALSVSKLGIDVYVIRNEFTKGELKGRDTITGCHYPETTDCERILDTNVYIFNSFEEIIDTIKHKHLEGKDNE